MRLVAALCLSVLLGPVRAGAPAPSIAVDNAARVPAAELESILADFRAWAARVYAYHRADPPTVTLRLTQEVPFGFYREGVVMLPPNADRGAMIEDWVHELTHHVTGHDSSFFFKEGVATHTTDRLFARDRRAVQGWPNFGKSCDEWVGVFRKAGRLLPLAAALEWPRYRGETPEQDFQSWQIYLTAGSFVGWYLDTHGPEAFAAAFRTQGAALPAGELERAWLAALGKKQLPEFDPATVLPANKRYRAYAERLARP
jgi:hypothetical protein